MRTTDISSADPLSDTLSDHVGSRMQRVHEVLERRCVDLRG